MIACLLLLVFGVPIIIRSRSIRLTVIKLDSDGDTRFGPVTVRSTNLRNAAFSVVSHFSGSTVTVGVANSTRISNLVESFGAMQQAGMTSVTFRTEQPAAGDK